MEHNVRPLTEGMVNKGGLNVFPSQVTKRPGPPPASNIAASVKTVGDWLLGNFGESAHRISGFECWRRETISGASFVTDDDGGLFVNCGGQAIIAFHRQHTVDKRPLYLVVDGSAGAVAELRRLAGEQPPHVGGRRDTLKLVYSA